MRSHPLQVAYHKDQRKRMGKWKKIVNDSFHLTLEQVLEQERLTQVLMVETRDHQEGISAFKEKRKPLFQGK